MGKALFLGLSAAILMGYSLIASAVVDSYDQKIVPISAPTGSEPEVCEGFPPSGYNQFLICSGWGDLPAVGGLFTGVGDAFELAGKLFGGFFQLLTFQVPGLVAASTITAILFVPLGFINGYIIFTAIRSGN